MLTQVAACRSPSVPIRAAASDRGLVEAVASTDAASRRLAVESICERYRQPLVAYAERQAPGSGEDVVQDVLCAMFERGALLRDGGSLTAWLYTATRNRAMDHHRRDAARGRRVEWLDELAAADRSPGSPCMDVQRAVEIRQDRLALLAAFAELPPAKRTTLVLRYVRGLSNGEIAAIRCVAGVKQEVNRSLPLLREAYLRHGGGHPSSSGSSTR